MFSFFKKKEKVENTNNSEFLDIESSMYNTEGQSSSFQDNVDYQNLVYRPPVDDAPKYKAVRNNIGVVIDTDQFGYNVNDFNSNVKTYELEKNIDEEKIEFNQEEVELPKEVYTPVEEMETTNEIHNPIEEIVVNNGEEQAFFEETVEEIVSNNIPEEEEEEFSIFGSKDGVVKENNYEAFDYTEDPVELINDVKLTSDGYKICPNCGAILNPEAPVCFMCSKSFVKK